MGFQVDVYEKVNYGPGTVVIFTEKSGYTRGCWATQVVGLSEEEYKQTLVTSGIVGVAVLKSAAIDLKVRLNAADLGQVGSEFRHISGLRIKLANGRQSESQVLVRDMISNILENENKAKDEIIANLSGLEEARVYLVTICYGSDIEYEVKRGNEFHSVAELPRELMEVVALKAGISVDIDEQNSISGKQLYVGFIGTPFRVPTVSAPTIIPLVGLTADDTRVLDITELLNAR